MDKNMKAIYYNIKRGIKNLIRWFPIIWNDRDFDNYYIEVMMYEKLRNTYNFFVSENSITNWDVPEQSKSLQALKICVTILERKQNEYYIMVASNLDNIREVENIRKCEERDMKVFGKLFGKYLPYWWD